MKIFISVFYCFLSLSTLANSKIIGESEPAALRHSLEDTIPNHTVAAAKDGVTDCNCDSLWVFEEMVEVFSMEDHKLLLPAYNADSLDLAHLQLHPTSHYNVMKFFLVMIYFKKYNNPSYIINKKLSARDWTAFKSYKEVRDEQLQWANYHKEVYLERMSGKIPMCDYFLDCIVDNPYDQIVFDSISNTDEIIQLKKEQDNWIKSLKGVELKRKWDYFNLHGEREEVAKKRQEKINLEKRREQEKIDHIEWKKKKAKRQRIGYFILAGVLLGLAVFAWIFLPGTFALSKTLGIGLFFLLHLFGAVGLTVLGVIILLDLFGLTTLIAY